MKNIFLSAVGMFASSAVAVAAATYCNPLPLPGVLFLCDSKIERTIGF